MPARPFEGDYADLHRSFVSDMLDDAEVMARFGAGEALPAGFGIGLDERVVEYPWLVSRHPSGRVLDAGSTLNYRWLLERLLPTVETLHCVTLAPEPQASFDLGVSYVFADLRELPLRDHYYDTVISISTLEHVGMDNTQYGGPAGQAADPAAAAVAAVEELLRVAKPGARILLSVPYGRREDFGWFRQFDESELRRLLEAADIVADSLTVYAYSAEGWQLDSLDGAADLQYRQVTHPLAADRAAAARGVVCIELTAPQDHRLRSASSS